MRREGGAIGPWGASLAPFNGPLTTGAPDAPRQATVARVGSRGAYGASSALRLFVAGSPPSPDPAPSARSCSCSIPSSAAGSPPPPSPPPPGAGNRAPPSSGEADAGGSPCFCGDANGGRGGAQSRAVRGAAPCGPPCPPPLSPSPGPRGHGPLPLTCISDTMYR